MGIYLNTYKFKKYIYKSKWSEQNSCPCNLSIKWEEWRNNGGGEYYYFNFIDLIINERK